MKTKQTRRPNLVKTLLTSAIAFMSQAVELQNRPHEKQRHEKVAIAMLTAWEKLLKAYLKKHGERIHEPAPRRQRGVPAPAHPPIPVSISFDKALAKVKTHVGEKTFAPVEAVLLTGSEYRNACIHLYGDQLDAVMFLHLLQCGRYFADFLKTHFQRDLFGPGDLAIMPVAYQQPLEVDDFLTDHSATTGASPEVRAFLARLTEYGRQLHAAGHVECILVKYFVKLEEVKKVAAADAVIGIDRNAASRANIDKVMRGPINLTPDGTAVKALITEDTLFENGYTLGYHDLRNLAQKQGYVWKPDVQQLVDALKVNPTYCYVRHVDPRRPNLKTARCFYHTSAAEQVANHLLRQGVKVSPAASALAGKGGP